MGPVLVRLAERVAELERETKHELLGSASLHASLIEGGQEYSSYPARCLLTGERRTLPGETTAEIRQELDRLATETEATVRVTFAREPFEIDPSHELPELVRRAAAVDRFHGISFWTDAALLASAGIPTVLYGPAGAGAHATEEYVELESLERCSPVYLEVARAFCASA
jgi:acetylornithine deacetylase